MSEQKAWPTLVDPRDLPIFDSDTVVFVDVDDTLIRPRSLVFHHENTLSLIDQLKKEKPEGWEEIVSTWREQRLVDLVHKEWPSVIQKMRERHGVYGLTQMHFGPLGTIASMEEWRSNELHSLGIHFSEDNPLIDEEDTDALTKKVACAFHKGIFFTLQKKSTILTICRKRPFVLIDDRLSHLEDMKAYCDAHNIPFQGFHYTGAGVSTQPHPKPEVADFQKNYLIKQRRWLEDEEAEEKMRSGCCFEIK